MPPKQRRAAGVVLATVLALSSAHLRAATCKTTEGTFTSNLVQPPTCQSLTGLCTIGTLNGKFPETYDFLIDTLGQPDSSGQAAYTGHSVITRTRGGATLMGLDSGVMTFTGLTTSTFFST